MKHGAIALLLCLSFGVGCGSTQEIETSPPQPRTRASEEDDGSAREAPFAIVLAQGETTLPDDVSHLRFRITEVRLRPIGGRWIRLPSDAAPIEITAGPGGVRRTLLDTRLAPGAYDSLAIAFDDVFVRFDANAGSPLTTARETPQRLAIELEPMLAAHTTVVLSIEPGASLTRSPDCRWFFVPVLRHDVRATMLGLPNDTGR